MTMHQRLEVPDASEQRNAGAERLARRSRLVFALMGLLFAMLVALAAILQVGGAVIGSGEVTVESSLKTISHPTGGVLAVLSVREGDHVDAGQELLRFDTTVSQVGSVSADAGLGQLLAQRARLEAEREGAGAIRFPPEIAASRDPKIREFMAREQRLFTLNRQERNGTLSVLGQRARQYEEQIRSYQSQIEATDRQIALLLPELEDLRELQRRKLVTVGRVNQMERGLVQLEGTKAGLQSSIAEARARVAETREQMFNVDKTIKSEAGRQLAEIEARISGQQVQVASAGDAYARSVIRAPQSGTVGKIGYTTIGSMIPPAQPIMQIVPDRDMLIVEARIRPQDIDQIRRGQHARVVFAGLDRNTTPDIAGSVIFVSPDLTHDERSGVSFFRIRIRLDADAMARAPQVVLTAGMPAEVFVQTGDRSILSFLFKPLMDQLRRAFREG